MSYKRVLTIQDISCFGQCSITVALPILSACGSETCIIPSAVLSTHTGGFSGFTFRDLTDDIPLIKEHWQKEGILFDAIYSGYLGSPRQIDLVKDIMQTMGKDGSVNIVDPAMGDGGQLYTGFDADFAKKMGTLCACADIILPNITEASFICGMPYLEEYDESYVKELCDRLCHMGANTVVLTGVGYEEGRTGVTVAKDGTYRHYDHRKISVGSHGTGDVFASAFTGALLRGKDIFDSAKIAADFTVLCIERTVGDDRHRYGVKFETALPDLIGMLEE